jgi:hypothetical protein
MGLEPTLEQMRDDSYPSKPEQEAILKLNALIKPCRRIGIDIAQKDLPLLVPVLTNRYANSAKTAGSCVNAELSRTTTTNRRYE